MTHNLMSDHLYPRHGATTMVAVSRWSARKHLSWRELVQLREPLSCSRKVGEACLLLEPPTTSRELMLARKVMVPHRAVRRGSATPTGRHPSVGLREVVLVEAISQPGKFQ
jgi:hypothetical protein